MMAGKTYGSADSYEAKLRRVMERLSVKKGDFNWNWDRFGGWVEFRYRGELYRFDHTVEKARSKGVKLTYGSDAFAQIVLALEDLARMVERGIYDLSTWVAGMKFLPAPQQVPECFRVLGFDRIPGDADEVRARYKLMALSAHPDVGGSSEEFQQLTRATEEALKYLAEQRQ